LNQQGFLRQWIASADCLAHRRKRFAHHAGDEFAAVLLDQGGDRRMGEQSVDRRELR